MTTLMDFLLDHPVVGLEEQVIVSERLAAHPFTIGVASAADIEEYSRRCRLGREGGFDGERFHMLLILNHCVEPNFRSTAMMDEAGVTTPEELLNRCLKAGEIAALAKAIYRLSGFDQTGAELVDAVKN